MAPITSSFIHDIEAAIISEVTTKLGKDSVLYPTPAWMLLKTVGRAGGRPEMKVGENEYPAMFLEYVHGQPTGSEIGSELGGWGRESWNVFFTAWLTPEIMELDGRDIDDFRAYAVAAADTLLRRIMLVLLEFYPSVMCELLGQKTNSQSITGHALVGEASGDYGIQYHGFIRYVQRTET